MFDPLEEWLGTARDTMARYAGLRARIDALEAEAAQLLGQTVRAYAWPGSVPVPSRNDVYHPAQIGEKLYGQDLAAELALVGKSSQTAAAYLVQDVAELMAGLPGCWAKVTAGDAPLWQARRVV